MSSKLRTLRVSLGVSSVEKEIWYSFPFGVAYNIAQFMSQLSIWTEPVLLFVPHTKPTNFQLTFIQRGFKNSFLTNRQTTLQNVIKTCLNFTFGLFYIWFLNNLDPFSVKMQSKFSQNAIKMQSKFSRNSVKI